MAWLATTKFPQEDLKREWVKTLSIGWAPRFPSCNLQFYSRVPSFELSKPWAGSRYIQVELKTLACWDRAIFVWPWNGNVQTKQKQQTIRIRVIWLVYQTDTNKHGFWLVKQTLGWKNFMPENFVEINSSILRFDVILHLFTIGQLNNAFSIEGFSLAGKWKVHVLIFSSVG